MASPLEPPAQSTVPNLTILNPIWEQFFFKLNTIEQNSLEVIQVYREIQSALNKGIEVDDFIVCHLLQNELRISKDFEEIEEFKKKNPFELNTPDYEALMQSNPGKRLLVGSENGLDIYFTKEQLKRKTIKDIFTKFEEEADSANQFVFQNMQLQWEEIKQKGLYSEHSAIACCALFSKLGLMQIECLTKTKRVFDSVLHSIPLDESQIETCMSIRDQVSTVVIANNLSVWQKYPNVPPEEVYNCIEKMNPVIRRIDQLNIEPSNIKYSYTFVKKVENPLGMGFENIGNSCYINATLQVLFMIPELCDLINTISRENKLFLHNLYNLLRLVTSKQPLMEIDFRNFRTAVFKTKGKGCFTDNINQQQDAHEFLVFVLDQLGWNPLKTHTCTLFDNDTKKHFGDIQASNHLSIEMNEGTLEQMIISYSAFEEMNEKISLKIDGEMKSVTTCKRAIQINEYPPYLFVHLKRFKLVGEVMTKNSRRIELPLFKDLLIAEKNYELIACINHHGDTIHIGHYTADIKKDTGEWIHCNDKNLSKISVDRVGSDAYIVLLKLKT